MIKIIRILQGYTWKKGKQGVFRKESNFIDEAVFLKFVYDPEQIFKIILVNEDVIYICYSLKIIVLL